MPPMLPVTKALFAIYPVKRRSQPKGKTTMQMSNWAGVYLKELRGLSTDRV